MTKLFICIFVEENQSFELQKKYDSINRFGNPATTFVLILSALVLFIWGLFPRAIMEKVARLADSFIVYVCEIEEVHYFGLECLKGGAISISIGIVLYVFFIRKVLIKEDRYIDLWPKWWDTENVIYRPLLMTFLPTVFGVICRILDSVVDYPVVFIRKTILKDSPLPKYHKDTVWYMSLAGHFMNICKCFVNIKRWIFKEPYNKNDYVRILTFKHNNSRLSYQLIKRSLSFGLLLFGVGFILTMAYLLFG